MVASLTLWQLCDYTSARELPWRISQWRHNEHDGISLHRRLGCLLNRLFRRRSKNTSKLRVTGLCEGRPPMTGGFPSQRASNTSLISFEISIISRHLVYSAWSFYNEIIIIVTSWWARWRLKSPASRLFTQPFVQAQIKENIKAPPLWPLYGEFTGDRWIPSTKGQ